MQDAKIVFPAQNTQCRSALCSQHATLRSRRIPDSALSEYNYYMDTSKLRITVSNMKNANSRVELERIKTTILENLSKLPAAPSVPFESRPPGLATVRGTALLLASCH